MVSQQNMFSYNNIAVTRPTVTNCTRYRMKTSTFRRKIVVEVLTREGVRDMMRTYPS
jgi:hypothetical protein